MNTPPRVTPTDIAAKIKTVSYFYDGVLTICVLTLQNGMKVVGESACASEALYDQILGEQYAYENAFKKVWPLEGYLLRERLFQAEAPARPKLYLVPKTSAE